MGEVTFLFTMVATFPSCRATLLDLMSAAAIVTLRLLVESVTLFSFWSILCLALGVLQSRGMSGNFGVLRAMFIAVLLLRFSSVRHSFKLFLR